MQRFSSLKHIPAETRRLLRDRFRRYLPSPPNASIRAVKSVTLADESLLYLLLNLSIDYESDFERVRVTYERALPPNSSELSLDSLVEAGWVRVVWGRISTPLDIARTAPGETMPVFGSLMAKRHNQVYRATDAARTSADLATVVTAIDQGTLAPRDIGCQTPEWVAARLWDRRPSDSADVSMVLQVWVDRWEQLGNPWFIPNRVWSQTGADAFRDAALDVIRTEPTFPDWGKVRTRFVNQIALTAQRPASEAETFLPAVPHTVLDRAVWLNSRKLQRSMFWALEACGDVLGLIRLLLADVEAEDQASAPHNVASRLIGLALERPEILYMVLLRSEQSSVLLADLLLYPATSALACLLIAQWQSPGSAWDRELSTRDDKTTKAIAFADAVSVMGHFLEQGTLHPSEAAALLDWMHKTARPGFIDDLGNSESMLTILRSELAGQSRETLRTMVTALTPSMPQSGLGTATFAAALDIVDAGKLGDDLDPIPLISAYIQSLEASDYALSANRVSISGAASLLEVARRTPSALLQKFLNPIDVKARLDSARAANENVYTVTDTIVRALRAHVRILSRAVVGLIGNMPDDLVGALVAAVRVGALKHEEKGRVAAFAPRYETEPVRGPLDRPIAADIGEALGALGEDHRKRLLTAILESDEPLMLAQLLSFAPQAARGQIKERITALTPSEAGQVLSLTEVQTRIEALLSAGLADAAAQFMDAEQNLQTLGNVGGRAMTRLRATLRLHLLRGEWTAIADIVAPSDISQGEQPAALETITFYRAMATLSNRKGDPQVAEQLFGQLQSRRPDVAAYAINLFAARISHLLGTNLFGQLNGAELVRGRQVLAEAEQMILHVRALSNADSEIFSLNKARLLLALGQPDQATALLTSLQASRLSDTAAAYSAVALFRMGRVTEAVAALDQAELAFGGTEVLHGARAHIRTGKPVFATASVSWESDRMPLIKAALLDLLQMDHIRQAEALMPPPESFDTFVLHHVRSAAGSVTSLVPMMKGVKIDSCEDDLSALIRELLASRLQFLGWSVPDQSKGGFTAKNNPGERDLLLQRDTTTLAVIEAVVGKPPLPKQNLTQHFQKLLGYSTCHLFFHLTYAYNNNPSLVIDHLKEAAEHDAPAEFKYLRREDLSLVDDRPTGFIARYALRSDEIKVVFLVLDMNQYAQREAAKTAAN
jgi:tetratricopeptide (TPR) repeat protein